jgi:hypothetical protein
MTTMVCSQRGERRNSHQAQAIFMRLPAKQGKVLSDRRFDLRVAGQGAASLNGEAFGGFLFCDTIVANAVVDDDASGFLGDNLARTFGFTIAFSRHDSEK